MYGQGSQNTEQGQQQQQQSVYSQGYQQSGYQDLQQQQQPYNQNYQQQQQPYQPSYQQQYQPDSELEEPVSFGDWMLSILLMMLPCVGIIMMLVWAFGSDTKKSKSNFFKAMLVWSLIWAAISIIMMIGIGGAIAAMVAEYY